MEPFERSCEIPEQKTESGVVTVSTKRSGYVYNSCFSEGEFITFIHSYFIVEFELNCHK